MLEFTTQYMDDYFGAYYANTEPRDYFSHAALTVNSFGIHGVTGSFISTLEFDGMLFFNSDPAPSQAFINTLFANAFQGLNLDQFLEKLLLTSGNEFLEKMTHVIIEIDGNAVTETNVEEDKSKIEGSESSDGMSLNDWAVIAIYAVAGIVGALLMVAVCCLCRCLCSKEKRQVDDDYDDDDPVKVKSIEIPANVNYAQDMEPRRSRTSRKGKYTGTFYDARERTPSPVRSIASQDSSKFTYNPNGMSMSKASFSLGSISKLSIDMPSIDLEAWQRQNTISPVAPAPFGNDISAIEQKERDLSLIEEGDEEAFPPARGKQTNQYLSRKSLSALEVRNSRSHKAPSRTSNRPSKIYETSIRESDYSTEESSGMMDTQSSSDVINDLRNLSLQFDRHRSSRMAC
jgi:hypothetical protein